MGKNEKAVALNCTKPLLLDFDNGVSDIKYGTLDVFTVQINLGLLQNQNILKREILSSSEFQLV